MTSRSIEARKYVSTSWCGVISWREAETGWTGWGTRGNLVSGLGLDPGRCLVTQKELVTFRKDDGNESTDTAQPDDISSKRQA